MSDLHSSETDQRVPRSGGRGTRPRRASWFAISVVLHGVLALVLVFLTPWQKIMDELERMHQPREQTLSSQDAEELDENLKDRYTDQLRRDVLELMSVNDEMEKALEEQDQAFRPFEERQLAEAPDRVEELMLLAAAEMTAATEAIEKQQLQDANIRQANAQDRQIDAADRLKLLDVPESVTKAQEEAKDAQAEVIAQQVKVNSAQADVSRLEWSVSRTEESIKSAEEKLAETKRKLEEVTPVVEKWEKDLAAADAEQDRLTKKVAEDKAAAKQAADNARTLQHQRPKDDQAKKERDAKLAEARAEAKRLSKEAAQTRQDEREARKKVNELKNSVRSERHTHASATREIPKLETAIKERTETLKQQKQELADSKAVRSEAAKVAIDAQNKALEKQKEAIKAFVAAKPVQAKPLEELQPTPVQPEQAQDTVELTPEQLAKLEERRKLLRKLDLTELYDKAREVEGELTDNFETIKAMELAIIRDVTVDTARRSVDDVTPVRPELNKAVIDHAAQTVSDLEASKDEVAKAMRETSSMITLGNLLMTQLQMEAAEQSGGVAIVLANVAAEEAAAEGDGVDAGDLAEAKAEEAKAAGGEKYGEESEVAEDTARTPPKIDTRKVVPALGRKVGVAGELAQWMVVDDWFTIGPWDNTGRRNIKRKFPPESVVDLDAAYVGKGGRPIDWQFVKTSRKLGMVMPPNAESWAIYYAYTELDFEQPVETWVALGSDDYGTLWVNGVKYWESATHHKPWNVAEAMVRVKFRQGRNRVLFRVENGQHGMGYSMLIYLGEDKLRFLN